MPRDVWPNRSVYGTCQSSSSSCALWLHWRRKKISEVKADEKQTGKLCQFCSNEGGTEEKGIPKERLVLTTDSEVTSDIKKKLISWGKAAAMGLGPRFA